MLAVTDSIGHILDTRVDSLLMSPGSSSSDLPLWSLTQHELALPRASLLMPPVQPAQTASLFTAPSTEARSELTRSEDFKQNLQIVSDVIGGTPYLTSDAAALTSADTVHLLSQYKQLLVLCEELLH